MERFDDIIRLWPEPSAATLARDINRKLVTVRVWRNRDSIPADAWPDIVDAGQRRNLAQVTLATLAAIAARKRAAKRAARAGDAPGVPANA